MDSRPRTLLAIAVATASLTLGILALVIGRVDIGVEFAQDGDYLRIVDVRRNSPAQLEGFDVGMVVVSVNDLQLLRLPQYVYAEPAPEPTPTPTPEGAATGDPSPSGSPVPSTPASSPPVVATTSPDASASPPATPAPVSSPSPAPTPSPTPEPTPSPDADAGGIPPGDQGTDGGGSQSEPTPILDPPVPTPVKVDPYQVIAATSAGIRQLEAISAVDLAAYTPENWSLTYLGHDYQDDLGKLGFGLLAGCLILGGALLFAGRLGPSLRPLAMPLAVATATPFLVWPLFATWFAPAVALAGVLLPLGMVPLAEALAERIREPEVRRGARMIVAACVTGAIALGLARFALDASSVTADWTQYLLVAAIPLVPGLATAPAMVRGARVAVDAEGGPLQSTELAVAAGTPVAALGTAIFFNPLFLPLSAWLAAIAVAGRFTVRPLARLLSRAQLQRDLVVAATETERARVAADIHDDALQELTLLDRRLDAAGDTESAEMARGVTERLRAICGDLRLPILDDLGVGPALDWLVQRIDGIAGGEVRLERSDGVRPPRVVELAFFRVAQEALANAARHGKPPIVVRYHATDAGAVLTVDDAGAGIDPGAADAAERAGRFGLLNMRQRAEQIGAILDVRPWPGGGTHVGLQWRPQ